MFWTWWPISCVITYACAKSPGAPNRALELLIEAEVDVDLLVERTIEGAHRRLADPAAGPDGIREEDELRAAVLGAEGGQLAGPDALGVVQDEGHELDELLLSGRRLVGFLLPLIDGVATADLAGAVEQREEVPPGQDRQDEQHSDAAQADADAGPTPAAEAATPPSPRRSSRSSLTPPGLQRIDRPPGRIA